MKTIALIDPDKVAGKLTQFFLAKYGYEVLWFKEATEAVNDAKALQADAFVVEERMPGLDGVDFAQLLRKLGKTQPFVLLSNNDAEIFGLEAQQSGVTHVVVKTTQYINLPHTLQKLLARASQRNMMSSQTSNP